MPTAQYKPVKSLTEEEQKLNQSDDGGNDCKGGKDLAVKKKKKKRKSDSVDDQTAKSLTEDEQKLNQTDDGDNDCKDSKDSPVKKKKKKKKRKSDDSVDENDRDSKRKKKRASKGSFNGDSTEKEPSGGEEVEKRDEDEVFDKVNDDDDGVLENVHSIENNTSNSPEISLDESESYLSQTRFDQFAKISPLTLKGIQDAGYERMTVIQEATLPVILKGKDVLAKARTGTGKTLAFLLPSIEQVLKLPPIGRKQKRPPIPVLIICPTRELVNQAAMEVNKLIKYHPSIGVQVIIGGIALSPEQRRLRSNPCQILVATPGRLLDHIENTSGFLFRLVGLKVLVLDEADRLLNMGFKKDLDRIIASLPKQRQTLLFTATVPPELRQICHVALKKDHRYINTVKKGSGETHARVKQESIIAPLDKQFPLLYTLLLNHIAEDADYKVLVFSTTAMITKLIAELLGELKLNVREIHSKKAQTVRNRVSEEFRTTKGIILVTSDVSARGVDYPDVTLVIQVGIPSDKSQYIHRVGRTGRKGKEGKGIIILSPWEDRFLRELSISKVELPLLDPDTIKKVEEAMSRVSADSKEYAYQAWLGYYNSVSNVCRYGSKLVQLANEFSQSMGLDIPPALPESVVETMESLRIYGLRSKPN